MKSKEISVCKVIIFIVSIFILFPCLSWPQKVEIKTEKGVKVVYNPEEPVPLSGIPSTLILKEDLVIGREMDKEDHWFSFVNSLTVDDMGNIYVLDPKEIKIRVFDPVGKLLRTFGRKGQGPGEFIGPGRIRAIPQGILSVYDALSRRITNLTLKGEVLKTVSLSKLPTGISLQDSRGYIYLITYPRGLSTRELIKYDPEFNPLNTFHSFEAERRGRVRNPFPINYYYDLTRDDYFLWLLSSKYEIHVVDPAGKTVRRIIKNSRPRQIPDKIKKEIKEAEERSLKRLGVTLEFPPNYPAVAGFFIDDKDRIFVRTHEQDGHGGIIYDVFDKEGRYFARFSHRENERIIMTKNDKIYCVITESAVEGIPLVKRYTMEWK